MRAVHSSRWLASPSIDADAEYMAEPSTVGDTVASGSAADTLVGEDAHVVAAGNTDAGSTAQDTAPVAAGGVCVGGGVGSRRRAEVGDLALVAAIGAFVAAFVFAIGRWGLPIDREQVLAWTLGLVVAVSLATGHRFNAARALRDWSVFAVLLVAYDYSSGAADWFGMPLQIDAPIIIDRALFPATSPPWNCKPAWGRSTDSDGGKRRWPSHTSPTSSCPTPSPPTCGCAIAAGGGPGSPSSPP